MTSPLTRKKSNLFVWIVLAVLVVSLTGFGVRSIGNGGADAVGLVGSEKVTANDYARALSNRLRAMSQQFGINITFEQGQAFGVDRAVLSDALSTAALDGETRRIGLSVGDELVKKTLLETKSFQGLTGKFDEAAYKAALKQSNMSAAEYDAIIRKEAARNLLRVAVTAGLTSNEVYGLALFSFYNETRNLRWALIDESLLAEPTREPSAAEIEALYLSSPEAYTSKETRKITYLLLTPNDLVGKIEVDEAALRTLYDEQSARFNIPARRIVDRLVYPNQATAQAALDSLSSGAKTFETLVTERGLTLADVDLGEVSRADLTGAAADAVFLLTEPGVAGPVETDLGPALFQVNAVLEAQNTSFEQVSDELHAEYVADRARRQIDDGIVGIDDLLAGGNTLEEIAAQSDMTLGTIDFTDETEDGIAAHEEFRNLAARLKIGDFPSVETMADGGIFALRLDAIVPPAQIPLTEATNAVLADWKAAETRKRLLELAEISKIQLEAGEGFAAIALTPRDETLARRQTVIEVAPANMITEAFKIENGQVAIVSDESGVALVKVTAITPFAENDPQNAGALANFNREIAGRIGTDIYATFSRAIQDEAGVTVNQSVINAVHTQIR